MATFVLLLNMFHEDYEGQFVQDKDVEFTV